MGVPVLLRCGVSWESLSSSPNQGPGTGSLSSLPLRGPELVSVLLALGGSLSSSSLGAPGGHCTSYLWRNHNGLHPSSLWGEPGGSPSFSLLQWGQGGLHPPLLWGAQGVSVLLLSWGQPVWSLSSSPFVGLGVSLSSSPLGEFFVLLSHGRGPGSSTTSSSMGRPEGLCCPPF